ncbi:CPBP family intramembrane glutamic endopeptidase [Halorubrum sp. BOL3-1]|uniref:CPBP family intramembrane glutamic endopeptidase n=1 Tax=Halorubrum sp. BOL3-1 TaxID=2497325 RepID=UPI0014092EB1|nr:CPBP family intramembrane glutamic endopeptidase [Halorubrum sp. BOL3-1]
MTPTPSSDSTKQFVVVGIVVFPVATRLAKIGGVSAFDGFGYSLQERRVVLAAVFGGIIAAPLVEEVLFRGFLFGSLSARGLSPAVAGGVTIALFSVIHFPFWGVAGSIGITAWSVLPTILRLRFDNLTGALLPHVANNVWSKLIIVGLGFV